MLDAIHEAKEQGAHLIAFPELTISGYLLSDKWYDDSFCTAMMEMNHRLLEASDGIAIAYGNIFVDSDINHRLGDSAPHPNKDGRTRKYNAAVIMQNGKYAKRVKETSILPVGHQPKTLFPNYRFFDDERYYYSLHEIATDFGVKLSDLAQPFLIDVEGQEIAIGFEVCEDLWCRDYREEFEAMNVTRHLINNGAELIVNLSASPWTIGKHSARDRRLHFLREDVNNFVPFLYVNNVGAQNNGKNIITFDGGTTAYDEDGDPVNLVRNHFEESTLFITQDTFSKKAERQTDPVIQQKYEAIRTGIGHIRTMNGWKDHPKFLVGLSGGVDSALVAALVSSVVGPENVLTVNMPSEYNSSKTIASAEHVARNLGVKHISVPIDKLVSENQTVFEKLDKELEASDQAKSLSDENIQAKIRGTSILSNIAGRYGYMFTNNGNKLEIALGYATLYGDVGGAIAPIGDLTKAEVFEMCKYINEKAGKEVIPDSLLPDDLHYFSAEKIQPSAELRSEQVDPMKFGYHCALLTSFTKFLRATPEDICQWFISGTLHENLNIHRDLLERWDVLDPKKFIADLEWFTSSIRKSVFKRIQAPPIIVTSTSAYGYDIRESQLPDYETSRYKELRSTVLKMDQYPA